MIPCYWVAYLFFSSILVHRKHFILLLSDPLNGNSHHPLHIFKGIILSESRRLRRINENDEDYLESLTVLETKCRRSNFNKMIIEETLKITRTWVGQVKPQNTKSNLTADSILPWTTEFPNLLKLSKKEKELVNNACVTYSRPPTLSYHLLNYRNIALSSERKKPNRTKKCGKCGLCGNHGKLVNMVFDENNFKTISGKTICIKNNGLNCRDFGIYAGRCLICFEIYVGQTKNDFRTRWNAHRLTWRNHRSRAITEEDLGSDDQALVVHYKKYHPEVNLQGLELWNAYQVIFLAKPAMENLDLAESMWVGRLQAKINIMKTFLPTHKTI